MHTSARNCCNSQPHHASGSAYYVSCLYRVWYSFQHFLLGRPLLPLPVAEYFENPRGLHLAHAKSFLITCIPCTSEPFVVTNCLVVIMWVLFALSLKNCCQFFKLAHAMVDQSTLLLIVMPRELKLFSRYFHSIGMFQLGFMTST